MSLGRRDFRKGLLRRAARLLLGLTWMELYHVCLAVLAHLPIRLLSAFVHGVARASRHRERRARHRQG